MILDADAEALLIAHLTARLTARGIWATVSDRVPDDADRKTEHVRVVRTGGTRRDLVTDQAQVTIDVRSGLPARAAYILAVVRGELNDLWSREIGGHMVYAVDELSGPYSNPSSTDPYRYSQSFLVAIRSVEVV